MVCSPEEKARQGRFERVYSLRRQDEWGEKGEEGVRGLYRLMLLCYFWFSRRRSLSSSRGRNGRPSTPAVNIRLFYLLPLASVCTSPLLPNHARVCEEGTTSLSPFTSSLSLLPFISSISQLTLTTTRVRPSPPPPLAHIAC
jgi:hypothetical protein